MPFRFRAARNASGTANTMPSKVPHKAICKVSTAGCNNLGRMLTSGGSERRMKSPICGRPLFNSLQLNCAPSALHCRMPRAISNTMPVSSQPREVSGVFTTH
ncbi:hypothetical protein D3C86_1794770 [compost metagenome]